MNKEEYILNDEDIKCLDNNELCELLETLKGMDDMLKEEIEMGDNND